MIGIDLTKPPEECIESLKRWLFEIESYSKAYHATIGHDITEDLKLQLKSYIQNARNRNSSSDNLDENQSSHGTNEGLLHNWGVPIIIVGCKSDYLTSKEEKISTKKSKDLQGQLRSMCMQLGAGLIYSSAVNDINCNLLKKYILHRLYPEHISMDLELEVSDS
jgi:dynein light intermediate chain 1